MFGTLLYYKQFNHHPYIELIAFDGDIEKIGKQKGDKRKQEG